MKIQPEQNADFESESLAQKASDQVDLKRRSLRAVKWSALGEILVRSAQPLMLLVLAKLLSPEDFGVVGVATVATGLAQLFQEFGVSKTLVQTQGDVKVHASNAFWINFVVSCTLYLAVLIWAHPISAFFKSPGSEPVLRVLGAQIVLVGLIAAPAAMLQREIRFKALFFVRFLPTILTATVAVVLAFFGSGVWALVWGTLAGGVAQVLLFWGATPWRPLVAFNAQEFLRMFIFSKWVWCESALAWLVMSGDSVVLGHYLGPEVLGVYRVGGVVVAYLSNIVFTPIVPVAFALLARLQDDRIAFTESLGKWTRIVVLLSLPLGVGAVLLGRELTVVFLGSKWAEAGVVVQLMGLRMGLEWLTGLNSSAFSAAGRPDMNVKMLLVAVVVGIPAYIWAAPLGLVVFCYARLITSQLNNLIAFQFTRSVLGLPSGFLWQRVRFPLLACGFMASVLYALRLLKFDDHILHAMALIGAGAGVYIATLWIFDRATLLWAYDALRQVLARGTTKVAAL